VFGTEAAVSHTSLVRLRQIRIHFAEVMRFAFSEKSVFSSQSSANVQQDNSRTVLSC
jgi:hypothetical protein